MHGNVVETIENCRQSNIKGAHLTYLRPQFHVLVAFPSFYLLDYILLLFDHWLKNSTTALLKTLREKLGSLIGPAKRLILLLHRFRQQFAHVCLESNNMRIAFLFNKNGKKYLFFAQTNFLHKWASSIFICLVISNTPIENQAKLNIFVSSHFLLLLAFSKILIQFFLEFYNEKFRLF